MLVPRTPLIFYTVDKSSLKDDWCCLADVNWCFRISIFTLGPKWGSKNDVFSKIYYGSQNFSYILCGSKLFFFFFGRWFVITFRYAISFWNFHFHSDGQKRVKHWSVLCWDFLPLVLRTTLEFYAVAKSSVGRYMVVLYRCAIRFQNIYFTSKVK